MKKKAIKIAASTAVAASAFVAAAPAQQADAATNVNQLITDAQNAGTVLKWAISVEGTADYKSEPWTEYNNAKNALKKAEAAIAKLDASAKLSAQAKLVDPKVQISRAGAYIDAITSGKKIIAKNDAFEAAVKAGNLDQIEKEYHVVTEEFRKQTILNYRVYGQSTRDEILKEYKLPIEKTVRGYANEVTVHMLTKAAAADVKANKLEDAAKKLSEAQSILNDNDLKWETTLQKSADDVAASMPLQVLTVARVDANTVTVKFSKEIPDLLAAGQFTFNNGLIVHSASLAADKKTVTLTTSAQASGKTYDLSYQGVATGKSFTAPVVPGDDSFVVDQADVAYLDLGQTRTYTVSVKNTDNKPFNGPATIDLLDFEENESSEVEFVSVDGKTTGITGSTWTGDIANGKVIFVVKATTAQVEAKESTYALPVITLGTDNGNGVIPAALEAGESYFVAEASIGPVDLDFSAAGDDKLLTHDKTNNYFIAGNTIEAQSDVASLLKYRYDSNDVFVNGSLDTFKNALSNGDKVSVSYNPTTANASTFNITSDITVTAVAITNPSRAVSQEGTTFRFEGKGTTGYKVELYRDVDNDGVLDPEELANNKVSTTATVSNGAWTIDASNLTENAVAGNNYIAVQFISTSSAYAEVTANGSTVANTNLSATYNSDITKAKTVYRESFTPETVELVDRDGSGAISTGDRMAFEFDGAYNHKFGTFTTGTITIEQNLKTMVVNVKKIDNTTVEITGIVGNVPTDFDLELGVATKINSTKGLINQDKLNLKPSKTSTQNVISLVAETPAP